MIPPISSTDRIQWSAKKPAKKKTKWSPKAKKEKPFRFLDLPAVRKFEALFAMPMSDH